MDDDYSFDYGTKNSVSSENKTDRSIKSADKMPINADKVPISNLSAQQKKIWQFVEDEGNITSRQAEILLEVKQRRARTILGEMVDIGLLERHGAYKNTMYVMRQKAKKDNR